VQLILFVTVCVPLHRNITVLVTKRGQPYKEVCPGENYTLSVTFGKEARAALVTVSGGTLRSANVGSW